MKYIRQFPKSIIATTFVFTLLIVSAAFTSAGAQATTASQVSGQIRDSSGAAIPGATVTITNVDTSISRSVPSGADGGYTLTNLQPGPYSLQVTKDGFSTFTQTGIVLQLETNPVINVTMTVGAVKQSVEVKANAAMVETQNTAVGSVIQPEQVVDLPLNDRQPTQLIGLAGAAVNEAQEPASTTSGLVNNLDYPTAVSFSVAGSQGNETNYFLDGAFNMDYRTNVGLPLPFPDALQEFKVEASALPANSGSHPGGSVNAITKSGTNQFHGTLFEFFRNTDMDARLAFSGLPDQLKRNQFGGVVGGPIMKNKLFFFTGFQGTTERVQALPEAAFVPTEAALAGNFQTLLSPPCQASQVYLNSAYVTAPHSNILSVPLNPVALKLAALLPKPADQNCGQTTYSPFTSDDEFQGIERTDWQRTDKDALFARYFITNYALLPYYLPGNLLTASNPGLSDQAQSIDLGDTYIITPLMVSSLRLSFARTATVRKAASGVPTLEQLGSNITQLVPHFTGQNIVAGYFNPIAPAFPGYDYENLFGISEDIGWTHGAHQINFGFQGTLVQMNGDGLFQNNGGATFSSGASSYTGNALADFLTGNVDVFHQGNGQLSRDTKLVPALYAQDNWKMTNRLQLDAGLRWDPYFPQQNKYGQSSDFSLAAYNTGKVSSVFVNSPPGVTFPGDAGFNGKADTNAKPWDFSPRVGIIFDPRGKGLETIRAGYGIFYDTSVMWNTMHTVLNPPWGNTLSFTPLSVAAGGGLSNPWFGQTGGNPFPTPLNPQHSYVFPINGTYVFENQNISPTYDQQWNLSFEKQLSADWMVEVTYLGNKTTHAWLGVNINSSQILSLPGVVGTSGSCTLPYAGQSLFFKQCNGSATEVVNGVNNEQARKALVLTNSNQGPKFSGGLIQDQAIGNASYNGLLLSAQHRFDHNFLVDANYTWSHCLDDGEIGQDITEAFQNPVNRKADWGNCVADRRQLVNLSLVVGTPKFSSANVERFAGNWEGSGIFTVTSGQWLNVTDGNDISLSGVGLDRPNQVGNPFVPGVISANPGCTGPAKIHTLANWFNPCAFTAQAPTTFGDTHRNSLLGPGNWNFDSAIWRIFPLKEQYQLVFRAEAFNLFNHLWTPNPTSTALTSANVGAITAPEPATNSRLLQLALKFQF